MGPECLDVLRQVAPGRHLALGVKPPDLPDPRESRPEVREIHFPLLVVMRQMAELRAVGRDLDDALSMAEARAGAMSRR